MKEVVQLRLDVIQAKYAPEQYYLQSRGDFIGALNVLMEIVREQSAVLEECSDE